MAAVQSTPLRRLRVAACLLLLLVQLPLAAALAAETDRGLIWRIEGAGEPSYLVGSIHLAPPSLYPLPAHVEAAFEASEALVVEVDLLGADAAELGRRTAERGLYPSGRSLRDELSAQEWADLERAMHRYGLPGAMAARQRPWLAQMTLSVAALMAHGYQQSAGIDLHYLQRARQDRRPVLELETAEGQLDLLSGFPLPVQRRMLNHTVRQLLDDALPLAELAEQWRRGDSEGMGEMARKDFGEIPEVQAALIDQRNEAMARKIRAWLADGRSYFIIAGAAHMVGETGLVEAMRRAGYRVRQL